MSAKMKAEPTELLLLPESSRIIDSPLTPRKFIMIKFSSLILELESLHL